MLFVPPLSKKDAIGKALFPDSASNSYSQHCYVRRNILIPWKIAQKIRKPIQLPGRNMAVPLNSVGVEVNHGHSKAPGHIDSPGVQHSSTSEVAPQNVQQITLHTGSPLSFIPIYPVGLSEL
jgi:hypothetical protein